MPKISVIIPCYNVQEFLPECLDSVLNQTFTNFEIICIDDCSTDRTKDILKKYQQQNKNIRIIYNTTNQRQAISRNTGIDAANGEYIYFMDSDDTISPDCFETLYNAITKDKCDIVMGAIKPYPQTPDNPTNVSRSQSLAKWVKFVPFTKLKINEQDGYKYYLDINCCPVNKLYNKKFLRDNGIYFINGKYFHEDNGFWFKILACKPVISGLDKETYFYRVWDLSTTSTMAKNKKAHLSNYRNVLKDALSFTKDKGNRTLCKFIYFEIYKTTKHRLFYFVWNSLEKRLKILSFPIFGLRFDRGTNLFKFKLLGIPICKWGKK